MPSVWDIYYSHWAKESNALRQKTFSNNGLRKTLKTIWCWFNQSDLELDLLPLEDCTEDMVNTLPIALPTLSFSIQTKMQLLQELVDRLVITHTPVDNKLFSWNLDWFTVKDGQLDRGDHTPIFCLTPAEIRFRNNIRCRDETNFLDLELKAENVRQLDAILALF